jgi:hypothetical protein
MFEVAIPIMILALVVFLAQHPRDDIRCQCGRLYCQERAKRGVAAHIIWPDPFGTESERT